MKLVLAEKPSAAQSIAKVLGAAKRGDGYIEGNGYIVQLVRGSSNGAGTARSL